MTMNDSNSDALVFFGATGDLAYKKIFPSLQAMVKRGHLDVPVIGVAKSGWNLDQLKARARDSLEKHGGLDAAAFDKLAGAAALRRRRLRRRRHVPGAAQELGGAQRPAHYLAIPPVLFGDGRRAARDGRAAPQGARVIVEKPFGRDLASARALNRILLGTFDEAHIFRIDHYLGKRPVHNMLFFRFANSFLEPFWNRKYVEERPDHDGRGLRRAGSRRVLRRRPARSRDVVQNHLFQVLANLAMEPPVRTDSESMRDEKVKVLKAIPHARRRRPRARPVPRLPKRAGRRAGLAGRDLRGACGWTIDSWRWQGVPFYIRAGKCLPVTCTEVIVRLRRAADDLPDVHGSSRTTCGSASAPR